jgi:hypothetical protein
MRSFPSVGPEEKLQAGEQGERPGFPIRSSQRGPHGIGIATGVYARLLASFSAATYIDQAGEHDSIAL